MHLFLRGSCRTRIGADDVLSKINALMDWRWCSPTCKRALGRAGIGSQGYDPLVRFKRLLIGQWHPEAGACALNCGWISCCVAAPTSLHLCPVRRPIAEAAIIDAPLVQSAAPTRQPYQRTARPGRSGDPDNPPDGPDMHFSADTQARRIRNGAKRMPGDKMTSRRLCPAGRGLNEESFIDRVRTTRFTKGTCQPGRPAWSPP
ncbi:MAG: hypothetical protein GDA36_08695 [Rhodobacteraceae bacterium]|nr:hypothetical protein [Paracoccaceae bacterium]